VPVAFRGGHRADTNPGVIVGSTASADGWPLPDVAVTVLDGAGRQVGFGLSDDTGVFAVEVGSAGAVTVVVAVAGSQPVARTAAVVSGEKHDLGEVVLAAAGGVAVPTSGTWEIDPAHSIIRATARHIGLARVEGRFTDFTGTIVFGQPLETSTVEVTIQASSITTGNEPRDLHLRSADFLDVERFPLLTYRGTSLVRHPGERATISGELTIRDVTREVPLRVTYLGSGPDPWGGTRTAFTATAQLARRDYEISWNMGLPGGMTVVGPTLQIDLDIEALQVS
jgi:polyisoprenoid-binding protein YceI